MPYGGSRSRSEWVTPKISGGKTKVFLVESWYNSTLSLPYRLSHATTFRALGLPVQLDIWTSSSYQLSQQTTLWFVVPSSSD